MADKFEYRRALPTDTERLGQITMDGLFYWGHGDNFPELMEAFRNTNLPKSDYILTSPVYVLENEAQIVGFFGLTKLEDDDSIDLTYLFVDPKYIGQKYGKHLWQKALETARSRGYKKMRILSDPGAVWFYEAMGAKPSEEHEVAEGFVLTQFWHEL